MKIILQDLLIDLLNNCIRKLPIRPGTIGNCIRKLPIKPGTIGKLPIKPGTTGNQGGKKILIYT